MAWFEIDDRSLRLTFSWLERLGGLRSGAFVPLADVQSVEVVSNPWKHLKGVRVGTGAPYVVVLGTMLRAGPNDVVAVYGRRPAVVVTLRPNARYQRLIASVPEPDKMADQIRKAILTG